MNLKRSLLLNLFLPQQLLGANDNFLSNIMIFCLIQQHNCHICQRGLLFVHHFHSPQSWGLHHQCSQKVVSLNLKLLPPNLMNLAFFVYETYPSVVPDKNQSLDDCCDAPGLASAPSRPGLDAKFQTSCLVPFTRISSCHFLMLLSFSSWTGSTVDQIWNLFLNSNSLSTVFF